MLVVGLSGFVGSGKTTVAEWFITNHGFRRVSFADPIRAMIAALGVSEDDMRDPKKKELPHRLLLGRSPRYAMERLGQDWGRAQMHPQFWIGHFAIAAEKKKFVICDDVRYPNEVEAIHELGGKVYKLIVPGRVARVASDNAVESVIPDEVILNDYENGGPTAKAIYEYIYSRTFRPDETNLEPPGGRQDVRLGHVAVAGSPGAPQPFDLEPAP